MTKSSFLFKALKSQIKNSEKAQGKTHRAKAMTKTQVTTVAIIVNNFELVISFEATILSSRFLLIYYKPISCNFFMITSSAGGK